MFSISNLWYWIFQKIPKITKNSQICIGPEFSHFYGEKMTQFFEEQKH
jgi:hypothetical protein